MKKRFAALLALWMMLCAAGAIAECGYGSLMTSNPTTGSYRLPSDVDSLTIQSGHSVTLCLHGMPVGGGINIESGAQLTLEDCQGGGTVTGTSIGVENYGTFTMLGGTVTAQNDNGVENYGTFTMLGGTVTAQNNNNGVENYGTFTMTGGTVTSQKSAGVYNSGEFTMSGDAEVTGGMRGVYNTKTFMMNGGTVKGNSDDSGYGVANDGEFTMNGGEVKGVSLGVDNQKTFTMNGGEVEGNGDDRGHGVMNAGEFTMNGGEVKGVSCGLNNHDDRNAKFAISEGTITGQTAVNDYSVSDEAAAEKKFILPGSYKEDGAFFGPEVIVKRFPAADLPETGDASMLGAWALLLGASCAGLKLRRKK